MLAIAIITDEMDCSVAAPGGYSFFTDIANDLYWNPDPSGEDLESAKNAEFYWKMAIPVFDNRTPQQDVAQIISLAIIDAFSRRGELTIYSFL